jgi:hypothetical protein
MKTFRVEYWDYCSGSIQEKYMNAKELAEFIIDNTYNGDININLIEEYMEL